jgi:hypothetical protein
LAEIGAEELMKCIVEIHNDLPDPGTPISLGVAAGWTVRAVIRALASKVHVTKYGVDARKWQRPIHVYALSGYDKVYAKQCYQEIASEMDKVQAVVNAASLADYFEAQFPGTSSRIFSFQGPIAGPATELEKFKLTNRLVLRETDPNRSMGGREARSCLNVVLLGVGPPPSSDDDVVSFFSCVMSGQGGAAKASLMNQWVGDIAYFPLNKDGEEIKLPDLLIHSAIRLKTLEWLANQRGRYVITVAMNAGGRNKVPVLRAALDRKQKLTNLLIVSHDTAKAMLDLPVLSEPSGPENKRLP